MALEGTLRDFSLADIFQLIGLQRKTGVLTLVGPEDSVTIPFEEGRIVGADSQAKHLEDRLGHVLIKTRKIDSGQLGRVLRMQAETGQRIGDLLLKESAITGEDLNRALQLQVTQIIYRLFRWPEGDFTFQQAAQVEYDRNCFRPIPVENILMEGLRILDEWPLIEKKVRSFSLVYERTDMERVVRSDQDDETSGDDVVVVSPNQAVVYRLVNGRRSVQDLIDCSELGEFETCKALYELLEKDLLRDAEAEVVTAGEIRISSGETLDRAAAFAVALIATAAFLTGVWFVGKAPADRMLAPLRLSAATDEVLLAASRSRLGRLEFAVRLFALHRGRYPASLDELSEARLVAEKVLRDPWGRPYGYVLSRRNFQLRGLDRDGAERPELIVTGRIRNGRAAPGARAAAKKDP